MYMIYSNNLREKKLKNKIALDFFNDFDNTQIINEIDFTVSLKRNTDIYMLWAEVKKAKSDIYKSFVQLILTIGKKRIFDKKPHRLPLIQSKELYLYCPLGQHFYQEAFSLFYL